MHKPMFSLALFLLLAGCAEMKEKMSQMKEKTSNAAAQEHQAMANAAARHDPTHPNHPNDGAQNNGGSGAGASGAGQGGTETATAAGGAVASTAGGGSASDTSGATGASGGSADANAGDSSAAGAGAATEATSDTGGSGASGGDVAYDPLKDCATPTNKPEDVEKEGTERWGWTDAKTGWFIKVRYAGGMEMSQEAVDSREKSFLLESKMVQNGALVSCNRVWTARLNPKYEPAKDQDGKEVKYEQKITDLPDETVTISGKSYTCKVKKCWTKMLGTENTATSWTCEEIPGWLVKSVAETPDGPQVSFELLELRM